MCIAGYLQYGKGSKAYHITLFLYESLERPLLILPKNLPKLCWLVFLGLWQLLDANMQAFALTVMFQLTLHGYDYLILWKHNIASPKRASWLKFLVSNQTFLANRLLSLLQSILTSTFAAKATAAINLEDFSHIREAG